MKENSMQDMVNYCKQYGFIFQGSEIYGGLANTWDFGPVGALLKDNVKKAWLKKFIQEDENNVGLDSRYYGNYYNSLAPANENSGTKRTAGFSENWKTKNIYDLAGNVWEWTSEASSSDFISRGGSYALDGGDYPVTCCIPCCSCY